MIRVKDLISLDSGDSEGDSVSVELLLDKCVAEIFVNKGRRYIVREVAPAAGGGGLEFSVAGSAGIVGRLEVAELKSMWEGADPSK